MLEMEEKGKMVDLSCEQESSKGTGSCSSVCDGPQSDRDGGTATLRTTVLQQSGAHPVSRTQTSGSPEMPPLCRRDALGSSDWL